MLQATLNSVSSPPRVPAKCRYASIPGQPPRIDDNIYRRFFLAGIATILLAGAAWGTLMLYQIGVAHSFTAISVFEINAHGHSQIAGWVGLFIMGFAYQAFPKRWQARLIWPHLAIVVFVAMLVGLIVKTTALAAAGHDGAATVALVAGMVELAAITTFALQIYLTFARGSTRLEPWIGFVFMSLFFFIAQASLDVWHTWTTMTAVTRDQLLWYVSTYQAPLRDLQIHGLALFMILGVNQRLLPGLFQVSAVPPRRAWAALGVLSIAVFGEVGIFIAYRWTGNHLVAAMLLLAWLMLVIGVAMIALPWKLWRPFRDADGHIDRCGKFIRMAYTWLAISLTMLLFLPVYQYLSGIPFSHAYYGAVRHAITVGFVSLMIMGFAAKVTPRLNGVDARQLTRLWGPFILINLGCLLRVSLQTSTDWNPHVFAFVGISGVLELTALTWWGSGLIRIMLRGRRPLTAVPAA